MIDREGPISVSSKGGIRIITLNRPENFNAVDIEMNRLFEDVLRDLSEDAQARAVVLTGAGRAFSAGGNLDEFRLMVDDRAERAKALRVGRRQVDLMLSIHVPVIAAVNGPAVGQGATLASMCDIIFMAEGAYFADMHVNAGLAAGDGGGVGWPNYTSLLKVKELLFTGARVPAETAVELGMANYVTAPDELMPRAIEFAERVAALPPQAVQATKSILNQPLRLAAVTLLEMGLMAENISHDEPELERVLAENLRKRDERRGRE